MSRYSDELVTLVMGETELEITQTEADELVALDLIYESRAQHGLYLNLEPYSDVRQALKMIRKKN